MKCHYDGEVWGLDVYENSIYTTGDDNLLMHWSLDKH